MGVAYLGIPLRASLLPSSDLLLYPWQPSQPLLPVFPLMVSLSITIHSYLISEGN